MPTLSVPRIIAHRGASASRMENTIAAFDAAVAQGADAIELDVRWTRDHTAVVYHDPLIACGRRKAAVKNLAASEFISLRAAEGVRVPTLSELLQWAKGKPPLVFDIKDTRQEDRLIADVEEHGFPANSVFSSFRLTVIAKLKARRPEWKTAWIIGHAGTRAIRRLLLGRVITRAVRWGASALHVHEQWIEPEVIDRCRRASLAVAVWTVDSPIQIHQMAEFGVDAIITNSPGAAREAIADLRSLGTP